MSIGGSVPLLPTEALFWPRILSSFPLVKSPRDQSHSSLPAFFLDTVPLDLTVSMSKSTSTLVSEPSSGDKPEYIPQFNAHDSLGRRRPDDDEEVKILGSRILTVTPNPGHETDAWLRQWGLAKRDASQ